MLQQQKQSGITHRLRCYNGGRCVYQSRIQELVQTESNYIGLYDTVNTSNEWKDLIEQYWITQEYSCMSGLEKKLSTVHMSCRTDIFDGEIMIERGRWKDAVEVCNENGEVQLKALRRVNAYYVVQKTNMEAYVSTKKGV
ncbi:hypothetical protein WN48_04646 [Eufriesea mexicana]|uniref:Uncharacterized protein n=1 Tax=Eufriesea mexicana TaxID=516756 RepID=A0A310SM10_9HYME|nr:hypothetical protein WN48_04646 [Eufriesea mexicana]